MVAMCRGRGRGRPQATPRTPTPPLPTPTINRNAKHLRIISRTRGPREAKPTASPDPQRDSTDARLLRSTHKPCPATTRRTRARRQPRISHGLPARPGSSKRVASAHPAMDRAGGHQRAALVLAYEPTPPVATNHGQCARSSRASTSACGPHGLRGAARVARQRPPAAAAASWNASLRHPDDALAGTASAAAPDAATRYGPTARRARRRAERGWR